MEIEESKFQSKNPFDTQRIVQIVKDFFFYSGDIDRQVFAKRILYVALAAVFSVFWVAVPLIHSLLLLGTLASLASLVVRRLRNLKYHWAIVFIGVVPVLGWIALSIIVALKARTDTDDALAPGRVFLTAGATFISLLILITSLSISAADDSPTSSETTQSAEDAAAQQQALEANEKAEAEAQIAVKKAEEARLAQEAEAAEEKPEAEEVETASEVEAATAAETPASNQTFDELVAGLAVRPEVTSGYDRNLFKHWIDADGDGCDARREVLIAESTTPVSVGGGCSLSGGTWVSAFDGVSTTNSSSFDVDHFVPLKEAWDSGANEWDSTTRQNFANDLGYDMSLIAVSASSNRSKGARDPSAWMPPTASFKCEYVYSWIQVKLRWKLSIDSSEEKALRSNWSGCTVASLDFKGEASGAKIGTAPAPTPEAENQTSTEAAQPAPAPETAGCVNINTASSDELQQIIHIGPTRAAELVSLRPFSNVDSLAKIKGISAGGSRLAEIKAQGLACLG